LTPLAQSLASTMRCEYSKIDEVLVDLAERTGDERYPHMTAKYLHKLNGLHGDTQIPKVVGLAREYEMSADAAHRIAAESFWHNVVNRRSSVTGGHGERERFSAPENSRNDCEYRVDQQRCANTVGRCEAVQVLKRAKGVEPSTFGLESRHSAN
jgi:DUF1680 family protein